MKIFTIRTGETIPDALDSQPAAVIVAGTNNEARTMYTMHPGQNYVPTVITEDIGLASSKMEAGIVMIQALTPEPVHKPTRKPSTE